MAAAAAGGGGRLLGKKWSARVSGKLVPLMGVAKFLSSRRSEKLGVYGGKLLSKCVILKHFGSI